MGSKNFDLGEFARAYVDLALAFAEQNPSLESFDNYLRKNLSKRFDISERDIISIHHPFHWGLFLDEDSPLELLDGVKPGDERSVRLKNNNLDREQIIENIFNKYSPTISGKYNKIIQVQ